MTAVFLQVVKKHFSTTLSKQNQPHTLALHLDFLRRTQTGQATFTVRDVKLGRQTSVVHVTLRQDGREEVVGYITQSDLAREAGFSADTAWRLTGPDAPPPPVDLEAMVREGGKGDVNWVELPEWPLSGFRKATKNVRTFHPRGGQRALNTYDLWMALRDPKEAWTNESVGFMADTFPQMLERLTLKNKDVYHPDVPQKEAERLMKAKPPMWYPTLLLNLDFKKALPEGGEKLLFMRCQTKQIRNGRYDLEVVIMDSKGELVALSHHVVFAVSAARNTAKRSTAAQGKL